MAFDWLEHDGRRSVSEKECVGTVLPIVIRMKVSAPITKTLPTPAE